MARKTTRKKSTRSTKKRTTTTKVASVKAPWDLAKAVSDKPIAVLEVPWELSGLARTYGAQSIKPLGHVMAEEDVPDVLKPYLAKEYSWQKYVENRANNKKFISQPTSDTKEFTLREDQCEDSQKIVDLWNAGGPEFLLASGTGVGKTVTSIAAINRCAGDTVLVLCPKAVIPAWRRTLELMGDGGKQWIIIYYESSKKLIKPPASALSAKKQATKNKNIALYGSPWIQIDFVVADETHKLMNPISQQSRVADKMIGDDTKVLRLSATPGADPSQLHYLHRGLSWATQDPISVKDNSFSEYVDWCKNHGVKGLVPAPFGNGIVFEGDDNSVKNMSSIIFGTGPKSTYWATRRIPAHWPQQDRVGMPIELTPEQQHLYYLEWEQFKKTMSEVNSQVKASSKKTAQQAKMNGLAAQIRFRQKIGQIKVPWCIEMIKDLVPDNQVVVACIYQDTVKALSEALEKANISYTCITGKTTDKEKNKIDFQQGRAKVCITSVTNSISLHQGDTSVGGNDVPRRTIVLEPHWDAINFIQMEGRATRDSYLSPAIYPMAAKTIDEKVLNRVLSRMSNQLNIVQDSSVHLIDDLADVFGFNLVE